jgi:hypothetical protein
MIAKQLIANATNLCRRLRRSLPPELKSYATGWERNGFDIGWCWSLVKSALVENRAMWMVDAEIGKHFAHLQSVRDAKEAEKGRPLSSSLPPAPPNPWATIPDDQALAAYTPPRNGADSFRRRLPQVRAPEAVQQVPSTSREPGSRRRDQTYADQVRAFLQSRVVRRGPVSVSELDRMAKSAGLLRQDQHISRSSTFCRMRKELDIDSRRVGFSGGYRVWRLRPPAWSVAGRS